MTSRQTIKVLQAQRDSYRKQLSERNSQLVIEFRIKALKEEIKMLKDEIKFMDTFGGQ